MQFGFKTRENGEGKLESAIEYVFETTECEDLKQYILKEYVEDDFQVTILVIDFYMNSHI